MPLFQMKELLLIWIGEHFLCVNMQPHLGRYTLKVNYQ